VICDSQAQLIVGNQGWTDKGALWTFDIANRREGRIEIEDSQYLPLRKGKDDFFRLIHHESSNQKISIRHIADPGAELASVSLERGCVKFTGNIELWRHVDPAAIIQTPSGARLLLIDAPHERTFDLDLSWYNSTNYDLGYQGLVDCISIPAIGRIVVSVQRSSELVIIDPDHNRRVGSLRLADRGGNPSLRSLTSTCFLATDYDTICSVDAQTQTVLKIACLQEAASGMRQFIGDFDVGPTAYAVARPFSGDVVLLDAESLRIVDRAEIGGQPLQLCLLPGRTVITRDWQSGRVAIGEFRKLPA
jgi:hypothetical protein